MKVVKLAACNIAIYKTKNKISNKGNIKIAKASNSKIIQFIQS